MNHKKLRRAREILGLSREELAAVMETDPSTVKRWEMDPAMKSARPAPARVVRLMEAYLSGFRPKDWPASQPKSDRLEE